MKILISDKISKLGIELLQREPEFQVDVKTDLSREMLMTAIREYDALIVRSATKVTNEVIEQAKNLKVIGRAGTGVDNVDVEAATRHGIAVMNTPAGNSTSVTEHAFALMLALARSIPNANASLKQGQWDKKSFLGSELKDKFLGIIGLGKIGVEVARRALAFKMRVMAYDPYVSERIAKDLTVALVPLEILLRESDYITLHLALSSATRGFIDSAKLKLMKPTARLINCARGEVVDEGALYEALAAGKIAGAALDVFAEEPPKNRKLLELSNLICTPHIGASTVEAQENVGIEIAAQVRTFLKSGVAQNAVNLPSLTLEEFHKLEPFLRLGERMGTFLASIVEGRVNEIGIRYYGELAQINTSIISNTIVKALLLPISDRVNAINARAVAEERGITVVESNSSRQRHFSNLISLKLRLTDGSGPMPQEAKRGRVLTPEGGGSTLAAPPETREEWVEGTVLLGPTGLLNESACRLVSVDGIDLEAPLRGTLLFFRNEDTPGVVGHIGTTLGRTHINIAGFALGRDENTHTAIGVVNIDDDVSREVLEDICHFPAIRFARVVKL
ncbi:MAG: phosphoglycerate dehydrogenase [Acidobacteriia bacterium]|nr:phosphoglycerate dehydrogenase [Terriglobia bacterium]